MNKDRLYRKIINDDACIIWTKLKCYDCNLCDDKGIRKIALAITRINKNLERLDKLIYGTK